jgi:hypothetical protein
MYQAWGQFSQCLEANQEPTRYEITRARCTVYPIRKFPGHFRHETAAVLALQVLLDHILSEEVTMVAIPYDPTLDSLINPGKADDFFTYGSFAHGQIHSEAALCAEMSRVVYVKQVNRLELYLKRADFTLLEAIGYDQQFSATQYFIAKRSSDVGPPIVVVAIRGSEPDDYKDLLTDVNVPQETWAGKGRVHSGFCQALPDMEKLDDKLATLVSSDPRSRLLFTGHSLGAAIATLVTALHHPDYLYTVGSPRVGDRDFAESIHLVNHARYVNCLDLVTTVPPPIPGWVHVGQDRYIDRHGKVVEPSPSVEAALFDRGAAAMEYGVIVAKYDLLHLLHPALLVPIRGLADHAMINYLSGVMGLRP